MRLLNTRSECLSRRKDTQSETTLAKAHGLDVFLGTMKLKDLFSLAIETGIKADPRGKKRIDRDLKKVKDKQKNLKKGMEKDTFDEERTWNPYGDSRIINGSGNEDVQVLMVGVDIETPEVLLADRLREKGEKIDCLFIHPPEGRALADIDK